MANFRNKLNKNMTLLLAVFLSCLFVVGTTQSSYAFNLKEWEDTSGKYELNLENIPDSSIGTWVSGTGSAPDISKRNLSWCYKNYEKINAESYNIVDYKDDIAVAAGTGGYTPVENEDYIVDSNQNKLYVWQLKNCVAGFDIPSPNSSYTEKTMFGINDYKVQDLEKYTKGDIEKLASTGTLLFLHRTPDGMTVFENSRYKWLYNPDESYEVPEKYSGGISDINKRTVPSLEGIPWGSNVYSDLEAHLVNKNVAYLANRFSLVYTPVPHVLGLEGTPNYVASDGYLYSDKTEDDIGEGNYAVALMDETNNQPVPVLIGVNSGLTPFWSFQGTNLPSHQGTYTEEYINGVYSKDNYWIFQVGMNGADGKTRQPFVKLVDILDSDTNARNNTKIDLSNKIVHAATSKDDMYGAVEHGFYLPVRSDEFGAQHIGIGRRGALEEAIRQMRYPFLVSSVSLAMDETITQRNSSVNFMTGLFANNRSDYIRDGRLKDWGEVYRGYGTNRGKIKGFNTNIKDNEYKGYNELSKFYENGQDDFEGKLIVMTFGNKGADNVSEPVVWSPWIYNKEEWGYGRKESTQLGRINSNSFKTTGLTLKRGLGQKETGTGFDSSSKTYGDTNYVRMPTKMFSASIVTQPAITYYADKTCTVDAPDCICVPNSTGGCKVDENGNTEYQRAVIAFKNVYRTTSEVPGASKYVYGFHSFYSLGRYGEDYNSDNGVKNMKYAAIETTVLGDELTKAAWSWDKNDDFGTWRWMGITTSGLGYAATLPYDTEDYTPYAGIYEEDSGLRNVIYPWRTIRPTSSGGTYTSKFQSGYLYNKVYLEIVYSKINGTNLGENQYFGELNDVYSISDAMNNTNIKAIYDGMIDNFDTYVLNDISNVVRFWRYFDRADEFGTSYTDNFTQVVPNNSNGDNGKDLFKTRAYYTDKAWGVFNQFEKEYCKTLTTQVLHDGDVVDTANYVEAYDSKLGRIQYAKACKADKPIRNGSFSFTGNGQYNDSYSALANTWNKVIPAELFGKTADANWDLTYREFFAYNFYLFFSVEQLSNDLSWGRMTSYRSADESSKTVTYYHNATVYSGEFSNLYLLNEETRLNDKLQYGLDSNGDTLYFSELLFNTLDGVGDGNDRFNGVDVLVPESRSDDNTTINDKPFPDRYGPELYLIDDATGGYTTGEQVTPTCDPGYVQEGNTCVLIFTANRNPICPVGFNYEDDIGMCTRTDTTNLMCPDDYSLYNGFCVRYSGTDEVCNAGDIYDEELGACVHTKDGKCDPGWEPDVPKGQCVYEKEKGCPFGGELIGDNCVVRREDFTGVFEDIANLDFDYVGYTEEKILPAGRYLVETWGAEGGGGQGGKGGYTSGILELEEDTKIYINVGQAGSLTEKKALTWDFATSLNGWTNAGRVNPSIDSTEQAMLYQVTDIRDPMMYSPNNINWEASTSDVIEITYKSNRALSGQLYYASPSGPMSESNRFTLTFPATNGTYKTVKFYPTSLSSTTKTWNGNITRLRLDIDGTNLEPVYIKKIEIINDSVDPSFNGGGAASNTLNSTEVGSGGGGSDIRILNNTFESRIIVAGGGGGSLLHNGIYYGGGYGGGLNGGNGEGTTSGLSFIDNYLGAGGSRTMGGTNDGDGRDGELGIGGNGTSTMAGGGGGFYGGSAGNGAGGGSGFIFSDESYVPTWYTVNNKYKLKDIVMLDGTQTFVSPYGTDETGHSGHGYVRITSQDAASYTCDHVVLNPGEDVELVKTYIGQRFNFTYGEECEIWHAPVDGTYMLEAWGAQGGNSYYNALGGLGGFSAGLVELKQGEGLRVCVGGQGELGTGSTADGADGGFNGGGNALGAGGSGGGMTSIQTMNDGNYEYLLVAGGGGGGGKGSTWSEEVVDNTYKSTMLDDMTSQGNGSDYNSAVIQYATAGQRVMFKMGKYSNNATATMDYYIVYSEEKPTLGTTWTTELASYDLIKQGSYNMSTIPNRWSSNFENLVELTTITADKDGYYTVYTNEPGARGSSKSTYDVVLGSAVWTVLVYTDDSGNAGGGGGIAGLDSVKGVNVDISGYGGSADKYNAIGQGGDSDVGGAGGGGYYGGNGATFQGGGGGGSGYISSKLTDAATFDAKATFKATNSAYGGFNRIFETGHAGNGYARITFYKGVDFTGNQLTPTVAGTYNGTSNVGKDVQVNSNKVIAYCEIQNPQITENADGIASRPFEQTYTYTGTVQYVDLNPGTYLLEAWGAQGGNYYGATQEGGKGGYASGTLTLTKPTTITLRVGGMPRDVIGGWNGGGNGSVSEASLVYQSAGGGASDIRIGNDDFGDRILVAGGGGGNANYYTEIPGGYGGGLTAGNAYYNQWGNSNVVMSLNPAATQLAPDTTNYDAPSGTYQVVVAPGSLGTGARGSGGGYYGGNTANVGNRIYSGGGGSSYTSELLIDGRTIAGNGNVPTYDGSGTMVGNSGNGVIKISGIENSLNSSGGSGGSCDRYIESPYSRDFTYTNSVESVTLNPGTYKLEVWGAQGGTDTYSVGGKGGYSYGTLTVTEKRTLYVVVGEAGDESYGGYNGGGDSTSHGAAGGGATHIATATGELSALASNQEAVIIVAGGGGGGDSSDDYDSGGYGGGLTAGANGVNTSATSTSGYKFGVGESANSSNVGSGGGGYYGGYKGGSGAGNNVGGGGSGYVNNNLLTNAETIAGNQAFIAPDGTNETGHAGDGYVRITGVEIIENDTSNCVEGLSSVTIKEARAQYPRTCDIGFYEVQDDEDMCERRIKIKCDNGYEWDEKLLLCRRAIKPNGCTSEGQLFSNKTGTSCAPYYGITAAPSGNTVATSKCNYSVTVTPTVIGQTQKRVVDDDIATAHSTCRNQKVGENCDAYGNCTPIYEYICSVETARCEARAGCDEDIRECEATDGESCFVECHAEDTVYSYTLQWAHDGFETIYEEFKNVCAVTLDTKTFNYVSGAMESNTGWRCGYQTEPECPGGFVNNGNYCVAEEVPVVAPQVCPNGYVDKGTYCEYKLVKDLYVGSVTEDIESSRALTGDNLVVEVGQTYAFRNYVGFDPSTTRAYANKLGNITSSVFFPQITTDIWLFATEMGKTGCNRTDSTACTVTASDLNLQLPITISGTKIYNGNKPYLGPNNDDVYSAVADKNLPQYTIDYLKTFPDAKLATYPQQAYINDNGYRQIDTYLSSHLFAYFKGGFDYGTQNGKSAFTRRYAIVEFVFKIEEDGLYVVHRDANGELPTDRYSAVAEIQWPDVPTVSFTEIYDKLSDAQKEYFFEATGEVTADGKPEYRLKAFKDDGSQSVNTIALVSTVDSMSAVDISNLESLKAIYNDVDGFDELNANMKLSMMIDNRYPDDDSSALVGGFKAPKGDVFINRLEILDDDGAIVKVYDAMTDEHCTNPEANAFTETFEDLSYAQVDSLEAGERRHCTVDMNPVTGDVPKITLDKLKNYEVRIYTKYVDEADDKADPGVMEHHLEVIHVTDSGSLNVAKYLTSDGGFSDIMYISSGQSDRSNIISGESATFKYGMGWLPGSADTYPVSRVLKHMTVVTLEEDLADDTSKVFANNANPLIIPIKALDGVTDNGEEESEKNPLVKKVVNGETYVRIFYHDITAAGPFANKEEAKLSYSTDKFSILKILHEYKAPGDKFQFMLYYPNAPIGQQTQIWKQTNNPLYENAKGGTATSPKFAEGYEAVRLDKTGNYWGGLGLSETANALLDGSFGGGWWWYAVGCVKNYPENTDTQPGIAASNVINDGSGALVNKVELWMKADIDKVDAFNDSLAIYGELKGITGGSYSAEIGVASNAINSEKDWNIVTFAYDTGPLPDNKIDIIFECRKNNGQYEQLTTRIADGCLYASTDVYSSGSATGSGTCNVYAIVSRTTPDGVDTSTNIKWAQNHEGLASWDAMPKSDGVGDKHLLNIGDSVKIFLETIDLGTISESHYYAEHKSAYNNFTDAFPPDNVDTDCISVDKVNYSITDLVVNPTQINVDKTLENQEVIITGSYDVNRLLEKRQTVGTTEKYVERDVNVEFEVRNPNNPAEIYNCTKTSDACTYGGLTSAAYTSVHFNADNVNSNINKVTNCYSIKCNLNPDMFDNGEQILVVGKINGGENGAHVFNETTYPDNEIYEKSTVIVPVVNEVICDLENSVEKNEWDLLFDFVYKYDSQVTQYNASDLGYARYDISMSWTDYEVGGTHVTDADETAENDKIEYTAPIGGLNASSSGQGNELRMPDDYLAFLSNATDFHELCTDYRASNAECWRFEMNATHTVNYYKASTAITDIYTSVKTLPYSATPTAYGKLCDASERTDFGNVASGALGVLGGKSGSTNIYYDGDTGQDRSVETCHGYNQATQNENGSACTIIKDWWNNDICKELEPQFSELATGTDARGMSGHPQDYIPYDSFGTATGTKSGTASDTLGNTSVGYVLNDTVDNAEAKKSQTTKTSKIVLANTNTQAAENDGWSVTRTMDVCTLTATTAVGYSCEQYFKYGTSDGTSTFEGDTTDEYGVCEAADKDDFSRSCSWTSDELTPPDEIWYNDPDGNNVINGATCYRHHADFACGSYHSFSVADSRIDNDENVISGTCSWSETAGVSGYTSSDITCSSHYDCNPYTCGCDEYGNNCSTCYETCTTYWTGTTCSWTWTWSDGYTEDDSNSTCSGGCLTTAPSRTVTETMTANGTSSPTHSTGGDDHQGGTHMSLSCGSGDSTIGYYCYETYNDKDSLDPSEDERCIRWEEIEYQEVKYLSTESPTEEFISRTYGPTETNLWQWKCETNVVDTYPDQLVVKRYEETFSTTLYIETERTNHVWKNIKEVTKADMPRGGEYFGLKAISTYKTTRGSKPSSMPYLNSYYNNYHNLTSDVNTEFTKSPANYKHFNFNNASFVDVIATPQQGYCDVRAAEPYGCAMNQVDKYTRDFGNNLLPGNVGINGYEFTKPDGSLGTDGISDHTAVQGNIGADATWTSSNKGDKGVCYIGPDAPVWASPENQFTVAVKQKDAKTDSIVSTTQVLNGTSFGTENQYNAYIKITKDNLDGTNKILITERDMVGKGACGETFGKLCTEYTVEWNLAEVDTVNGKTNKMYIEVNASAETMYVEFFTSAFHGAAKYEELLLGENGGGASGGTIWGNNVAGNYSEDGRFFNKVDGKEIKPLCNYILAKISKRDEVGWGTTEWEVT